MIEVREAAGIAKEYFAELMGEPFAQFVRLEEVEINRLLKFDREFP